MDVLRLDLGCFAEQRHGIDEVLHRPQRLAAKKEHVSLEATGIVNAVERFDDSSGKLVAGVGTTGHPVTENGDQVEIALGFSQDLLATDATGIGHNRTAVPTGPCLKENAFLFSQS